MLKSLSTYRHESLTVAFLAIMLVVFLSTHPGGFTTYVMTVWANQGMILALVAMAQFFAVLVRGLDLSVGAIMALCNVIASYVLVGSATDMVLGSILVIGVGLLCGFFNGIVIVYGRIQPIIATLATASIFTGIALLLRPTPGGEIDYDLADMMTLDIFGVPTALIILAIILIVFWLPLRKTGLGLSLYAIGSSEQGAFQSGISVDKTRIIAFTLAGLFSALAGTFFSYVTTTGDASIGPNFTLNSIAAVVIGGVALRGGVGTLIGAVIGAFILKTIASLMFFSGIPPLAQPFVEGLILATTIALGNIGVLWQKNKLEIFK